MYLLVNSLVIFIATPCAHNVRGKCACKHLLQMTNADSCLCRHNNIVVILKSIPLYRYSVVQCIVTCTLQLLEVFSIAEILGSICHCTRNGLAY